MARGGGVVSLVTHYVGRRGGTLGIRGHGVGVAIRNVAPGAVDINSWLAAGERIASVGDEVRSGTVKYDLLERRDVGVDERRWHRRGRIRSRSRRHGLVFRSIGGRGSDALEHNGADSDRMSGRAEPCQAAMEARDLRNGRAGPHCGRKPRVGE